MKFLMFAMFTCIASVQGLGIYAMIAVIPKHVLYPMLGLLAMQFLIIVLYMLSTDEDLQG